MSGAKATANTPREPRSVAQAPSPLGDALGWTAVVVGVAIAALRCVVPLNSDLHWGVDPRQAVPLPELGPLGAAVLDWLAIVVLLLATAATQLCRRRVWWGLIGLWTLGLAFALWQGWQDAESLRIGGHWAGALALGIAAGQLAGDDRWRRIMLAALVAMIIPIGVQAMYGVLVEHPMTVADYEENRELYLETRGWEEGSVDQRKFEERLYQVQAIGRFSLGNVLGTVMATLGLAAAGVLAAMIATRRWRTAQGWAVTVGASFVVVEVLSRELLGNKDGSVAAGAVAIGGALIAAFIIGVRFRDERGWFFGIFAALVLGAKALEFTFSRGAILAVLVGVAAAAVACAASWWLEQQRRQQQGEDGAGAPSSSRIAAGRIFAVILLAVVVASVGAVVVRGMIGEPETIEGERSLLFRWHYWQAAVSMWSERPIAGVGPGQFQQAYLTHKNPLNPEDVSDPHNVLIFYIAGLGVGGLAWAAMLLVLIWRAGVSLGRRATGLGCADIDDEADGQGARKARWVAIGAIAALTFGSQYVIELPRYWIDAALLWMAATAAWVAMAGWLSGRGDWETRLGCVGLFAAVAAMAAHAQIEMSLTSMMAPPLLLAFLGAVGGTTDAAAAGESAAPYRPGRGRWAGAGALVLAGAGGLVFLTLALIPISVQQAKLREAAEQLEAGRISVAVERLEEARGSWMPPDARIARHEAQLRAELAERAHSRGNRQARDAHLIEAIAALERGRQIGREAGLWRFEAGLARRAWQMTEDRRWLEHAVQAAERGLAHDRYGMEARIEAAAMAWQLGDRERARRWYRELLTLHEQAYLDQERQLQPEQLDLVRRRLEDAAAG